MNKLITKIVGAALGLTMTVGVGVAVATSGRRVAEVKADEAIAYNLVPASTGSSAYNSTTGEVTIDSVTWNVEGNGTLNNNAWRLGGKSSNCTAADRRVYSKGTVSSEDITKVTLEIGTASSITVNDFKLLVGTSAGGSQTSTVTETFAASSTITFNKPNGADWSSKYFTFFFNLTVAGTSNKFVEFKNAKFYYNSSSAVTYSVTYDGNTNDSGSVPVDSNSPYADGSTVTVLGNPNSLGKTGYTFNGWNTYANGTGIRLWLKT